MKTVRVNKKRGTFAKSLLAVSISSSVYSSIVLAAEDQTPEEITVTGIRASIQRAMDVKREADGVVDAISAEDMGKFPDTNLAESLQRISGVSISRSNGEGAQITVRGFGGSNNMVTLNGRTMPTGGISAGYNAGTIGRSFDFGNLASEGVKAVEVYKTGKANIASGGIGASVNIITSRPIETDGMKVSVGAKAAYDTTNNSDVAKDITPEVSGLISYANDDKTLGISLSAVHQERNSGQTGATENGWNVKQWNGGLNDTAHFDKKTVIENAPAMGQLYAMPNDWRYHFFDNQRVRDNAQLTLQFRPVEKLLATVDYTYARNQVDEQRGDKTIWLQNALSKVVFDKNPVIAIPQSLTNDWNIAKDNSYAQASGNATNVLRSTGINLKFEATDNLTINLDAHKSELDGSPTEDYGSSVRSGMATAIGKSSTFEFNHELPKIINTIDDKVKGNGNGISDIPDLGSTVYDFNYAHQLAKVDEVRLNGKYDFDTFALEAGIENRKSSSLQQQSAVQYKGGDNSVNFPGDIPDYMVRNFDYLAGWNDIDHSGYDGMGFRGDAVAMAKWAADKYGFRYGYNPNLSTNTFVEEEASAGYLQGKYKTAIFDMPLNILAGVRYEKTEVTSSNNMLVPKYILWTDNNDFTLVRDTKITKYTDGTSYHNLLPNLDIDLAITDQIKARTSFSKTTSRPGYGSLTAGATVSNNGGMTTPLLLTTTPPGASAQNPKLLPLESTNIDLSVEYYFDETSYVSLGFFHKNVKNFIGTQQVLEPQYGLQDASSGPRAQAAADALRSIGQTVNEDNLFVMAAILDNPQDFPNGAAAFKTPAQDPNFFGNIAFKYDLVPTTGDPVIQFLTSKPVNNKDAIFHGFEIAGQHFFGESGFGVQANYTIVRGDTEYDNSALPNVNQFALTGLSDTANLVAMYEKGDWQARVAYNWRDKYLASNTATNPTYVAAYFQIDMNVSYAVTEALTVSFEGLNLTGEGSRSYGRSKAEVWNLYDLGPRYDVGVRYTF